MVGEFLIDPARDHPAQRPRTEDAVAALLGEHVLGGLEVARASVSEVRNELRRSSRTSMIPPVSVPEKQGCRQVPDRVYINAIEVTGVASAHLPREPGCSGTTAWRLLDRQAAWVWAPIQDLLDRLNARDRLVVLGGRRQPHSPRALRPAGSPVDRGRTSSMQHVLVDPAGIPLAISLTDGKPSDRTQSALWPERNGLLVGS